MISRLLFSLSVLFLLVGALSGCSQHAPPQFPEVRSQPQGQTAPGGAASTGIQSISDVISLEHQEQIVRRAVELNASGKPGEAQKILEPLLAKNPYNLGARNSFGFSYLGQGMTDKALNEFRIILAIDPKASFALVGTSAVYMSLKQYDAAEKELQTAVKLKPDFWVYRGFGDLYQAWGKKQEARKAYNKALAYSVDQSFKNEVKQKLAKLK